MLLDKKFEDLFLNVSNRAALSSYFFIGKKDKFKNDIVNGSQNTPVLLIHGSKDKMVLPVESEIALKLLLDVGYEVKLETLAVGHKIPLQAKSLIENFIDKVNLKR